MDKPAGSFLRRLAQAVPHSWKKLDKDRERQRDAVKEYVGYHYGDQCAADRRPLNMVQQMVTVYVAHIVASDPQFLISSKSPSLMWQAGNYETDVNRRVRCMNLADTLRSVLAEAMLGGLGITHTGLSVAQEAYDPSGVYASRETTDHIPFGDWVHDVTADNWRHLGFMGHRYLVPLEFVKESGYYDGDEAKKLEPDDRIPDFTQTARSLDGELDIGRGPRDMVVLQNLWLPRTNQIITCPHNNVESILRVADYDGPDGGPYDLLWFFGVPGNLMPLAAVNVLMDLHLSLNVIINKCTRQAERQKELWQQRGSIEDAEKLLSSPDGYLLTGEDAPNRLRMGGPDPANMAFATQIRGLASMMGGNLDSLGGLGQAADTLGQERMIAESASVRLRDMEQRFTSFVRDIGKKLAWYAWTEPLGENVIDRKVVGNESIKVLMSPETRAGTPLDYDFDIEPYSMTPRTPAQRLAGIQQTLNALQPFAPMFMQQGIVPNADAILDTYSKLSQSPELKQMFIRTGAPLATNPQPADQQAMPEMRMPANTNRTYTRVGRPGMTREGSENQQIQQLMTMANRQQEGD